MNEGCATARKGGRAGFMLRYENEPNATPAACVPPKPALALTFTAQQVLDFLTKAHFSRPVHNAPGALLGRVQNAPPRPALLARGSPACFECAHPPPPPFMNAPRALLPWVLFGGSLAANVFLATRGASPDSGASALRSGGHENAAVSTLASGSANGSATTLSAEAWKNVYSEELPALTQNLRAAGLPDRLVRAIVGAEINERFKAREDALKSKQAPSNYWDTQDFYERNVGETLERRLARLDLRREKDALRVALLGEEPPKPGENNPIPPAKRDDLRRITEDYDAMIQQIESESRGLPLASDREKLAYLRAEKDKELRELLSPEEYEANQLRTSRIAQNLRWELAAFKPTEDEFVLIHKLREADPELSRNADNSYTSEDWNRRRAAEKRLNDTLRQQMGEDRYQDYTRAKNYDYRQLAQLGARLEVPKADINEIYDQQRTVPDAALVIAKDPKLTRAEKESALKAMAEKARQSIYAKLGQEAGEAYLKSNQGSNWLQSLEKGTIIVQTDENSRRHYSLDEFSPREPKK